MRYSNDVLSDGSHRPTKSRPIPIERGMILEEPATGYVGEVMSIAKVAGQWQMVLEDRVNHRRTFPLGPGFWFEGEPVVLEPPVRLPTVTRQVTASGGFYVNHRARVARPSRIWVEGKHDAELVSKIWGSDLAYAGIIIEELFGADNLEEVLDAFGPSDRRRAGVLLDHMVPGSKEARIAETAMRRAGVRVLGHPYVDVWQAVKPATVGIPAWPDVPRSEDIKQGTLRRLGWPHETADDIGMGWTRILDSVHTYTDLEPSLLARMEELIDFVTAGNEDH